MRVVALISGGKDSCYNMMQCVSEGHDIVALANLYPKDKDELDSYMYQTVGHHAIELYAEAMSLPLYRRMIQGSSKQIEKYYSPTTHDEVEDLYELLKTVMSETEIDAVSSGAILSDYQRVRVENVCERLGLVSLAYLWRRGQQELMREMIDCHVEAVLIKVAALGLEPKKHLGKYLTEIFPHMQKMEADFGLHICGEGGEFETITLDCPLFKKKLVIDETEMVLHSEDAFAPVGYLNLKKMHLEDKPVITCSNKEILQALPMKRGNDLLSELFTEEERSHLVVESDQHSFPMVLPSEQVIDVDVIQTRVSDRWFYITGIVGVPKQGETTEQTTKRVMDRLKDTVEGMRRKMEDLVSVCMYVDNMANFSRVNSIFKSYFSINPPIRVCVQAASPSNISLLLDCQGVVSHDEKVKDTMHVQSISHWASSNIGPYSQAVQIYDRLCVAGQIALCPASMEIIAGGIISQSRLSLRHLWRVLTAMHPGITARNITYVICYVTSARYIHNARQEWRQLMNSLRTETYGEDGPSHEPLLEFVVIPRLPRNALVEWQAEAYAGQENLTGDSLKTLIKDKTSVTIDYCCTPSSIVVPVFSCRITVVSVEKTWAIYEESTQEVFRTLSQVLDKHSLTSNSVHLCRIFYPVSYIQYTQLFTVISAAIKSLGEGPVFSLLPVISLSTDDCIMSLCC